MYMDMIITRELSHQNWEELNELNMVYSKGAMKRKEHHTHTESEKIWEKQYKKWNSRKIIKGRQEKEIGRLLPDMLTNI